MQLFCLMGNWVIKGKQRRVMEKHTGGYGETNRTYSKFICTIISENPIDINQRPSLLCAVDMSLQKFCMSFLSDALKK